MKLALCQSDILFRKKEENIARALADIEQAAMEQCDLILFPEMSFTGFSLKVEHSGERGNETIKRMKQTAKEYDIAIGFGWTEAIGEGESLRGRNHYTIVDARGEAISDYVKVHPFTYGHEDEFFDGGDRLTVFEFGGFCCSNIICYDLRFHELFDAMPREVHLVIVPANWPKARREQWDILARSRAIDYQVYIAAINCYGQQSTLEYSGGTKLIAPDGSILAEAPDEKSLVIYDLEDHAQEMREAFPVWKDHKPDLYKTWK